MTATLEISPLTKAATPSKGISSAGIQDHLGDHTASEAHSHIVPEVSTSLPGQATSVAHTPTAEQGAFLTDPFLGLLAATVDDLESNRKALQNRYRALTRSEADSDGELRGFGLVEAHPDVKVVRDLLAALGGEKLDGSGGIEHQAVLRLNGRMRKHPLWRAWGIEQKGVGEKQLARLLAAIGDPYWNDLHDRPRLVSELWSYCGYSVVRTAGHEAHGAQLIVAGGTAPKKTRGSKVNWSTEARMRTWNIAGSCLKAQAGYADVYYAAREKYAEATHSVECTRCGPAGKPALVGSPLSDGHKHARAIRIMCKEILRDLWTAAKALHEERSKTSLPTIGTPIPTRGTSAGR